MGFNMSDLLFFLPMILIMYFLIFLPKRREQQALNKMIANLKKGDKVLTNSGMHGEVSSLKDGIVTLRFHDNVRIDFAISSIAKVMGDPKEDKREEKAVAAKA